MYNKRTLPNGVRIVYEHIPHVRSVAMGVWVGTGSRFEKAAENGASHFIEHMVFKGTSNRTAAQLAAESDAIGGQINAFTTKDCTCFYGRVLDDHLPKLADILSDMLLCSVFADEDVESERGVIFEEIDMYADTPDDLVAERLFTAVYSGSPLCRPVLGTKRSLSKMTGDTLKSYMASHYCGESVVISVSGSFTEGDIEDVASRFSSLHRSGGGTAKPAVYKPAFTVKRRKIEQNHLCLGFPAVTLSHPDVYAFRLLSSILGGGASSRLFQSVREKHGLCYTVATYMSSFSDTGLFSVYTALGKDSERQALTLIADELKRFCEDGVTPDELECARDQMRSNILMSLESTASRMNRMGRDELYLGRIDDVDNVITSYDAVTETDILRLAREYLSTEELSFSAVGRTDTADQYREFLAGCF